MSDVVDSVSESNLKSSLPPRKRAKTKEEKEQRRVERILRNRRAAHASREKKRKHVEYLESYVVKLEQNLFKLQSNLDRIMPLCDESKLQSVEINEIENLLDLKEKIHANLSSTTFGSDDNENSRSASADVEPPFKKQRVYSEGDEHEAAEDDASGYDSPVKSEHSESNDKELLSVNKGDNSYFNYLSPISINSPINSPIDLTLQKSDSNMPSFSLDDPSHQNESSISPVSTPVSHEPETSTFDVMGQNPEEILYPKLYDLVSLAVE
ncbi:hypothetical protein QFC19_006379 [Naganishia cerealis]|uniref:Uncharacterized protein n=2 Tax=Naganishia cerealis TaxID=610337 RepID=A0ACC2VG67_9TREE|nr:hypothetical protein QFC19_008733 [Naganishia cerealis]KAJ9098380.1 hypothetical protein QFC19_006379 [Naganishia cerealis]